MNIKISGLVIILYILSFNSSWADSLYLGNIGISNKQMDVRIADRSFQGSMVSLDASWALIRNSWFYSINVEQSVKDNIQTYETTSGQVSESGLLFHSRRDVGLTIGYRISGGLTAFFGARSGVTQTYLNASRDNGSNISSLVSKSEIKSFGPFVGASYSYKLQSSSVSASVAMAKLTGSASMEEPFVDSNNLAGLNNVPGTIDGDALGFSYTLSWSKPVSDKSALNFRYKLHRYRFEDQVLFQGLDFSYREDFNIAVVDFSHRF